MQSPHITINESFFKFLKGIFAEKKAAAAKATYIVTLSQINHSHEVAYVELLKTLNVISARRINFNMAGI